MASSSSQSLGAAEWELLDPCPDIHALFIQYNDTYFWGALQGCEVKWSPRMTLCAGLCCYEGYGGLCSIRLSGPLLKLRPRKDLVETLLHEMIHAYLFVTQNNRDRDGHGPEFLGHMKRINGLAGVNITVYHSFHDEVKELRQHWWKCQGPCKSRPPYYGLVKRSMNRAPSKNDLWWAEHQNSCGGSYVKIKEPDGFGKKKAKEGNKAKEGAPKRKKDEEKDTGQNIKKFFPPNQNGSADEKKFEDDSCEVVVVIDDQDKPSSSRSADNATQSSFVPFSGAGHKLGSSSKPSSLDHGFQPQKDLDSMVDCPSCSEKVLKDLINTHLDYCLS